MNISQWTFARRRNVAFALLLSHCVNICVGIAGFYFEYDQFPELEDSLISITFMMPLAKPVAFGGFLKLFNPYSVSRAFPISLICYWIISLSLNTYTWKTKKVWPFIILAIISLLASPLWFIVAIALTGI